MFPCFSPAKPPAALADREDGSTDDDAEDDSATPVPDPASVPAAEESDQDITATLNTQDPPLPDEAPPPLPNEALPLNDEDDGWQPVWDDTAQAFYFYNKYTQATQWENPRVPQEVAASTTQLADTGPPGAVTQAPIKKHAVGGYDPAIHGDYDPTADYAKVNEPQNTAVYDEQGQAVDTAAAYAATGAFNRFTGKWQSADVNPDKFSDENKSKRQMNAFFDVDAAANSHDGKSLKAERSNKKISKADLKAYREKRRERKEEKKRAWLRD